MFESYKPLDLFQTELQHDIYDIVEKGECTRDDICNTLGFKKIIKQKSDPEGKYKQYEKRTTIYDNITKLVELGLIEKKSKNNGSPGRPHVFYSIKGD